MSVYVSWTQIPDLFDIRRGDSLLVGSDVLAWAAVCAANGESLDLNRLIDRLLERLGPEGTLIFPTFHFGFCTEAKYDVRRSLPVTGALPRAALRRSEFLRTGHPIHSFAVAGRGQAELCGLQNLSSFGADSPFAWMRREKSKMWIIGLNYQGSFTFAHHAEEMCAAPYRHIKWFSGSYTDAAGQTEEKRYAMYVRDLERGVESDLAPIGLELERAGIAASSVYNGVPFRWVADLGAAYDVIARDISQTGGRGLHRISASGGGSSC